MPEPTEKVANLRKRREKLHLALEALARSLGIRGMTLWRRETGRIRNIPERELKKWAAVLAREEAKKEAELLRKEGKRTA